MAEVRAPLVIAIGGSDPHAGAGLQADAEIAGRMGAECFPVATMLTQQGTDGLSALQLTEASALRDQLAAAWERQDGRERVAVKTGALGSAELVAEVARFVDACPEVPLVVDPVRRASRARPGVAPLLDDEGWQLLCAELLPRAQLVTPNLREWSALSPEQWGCALRKGGHRFDSDSESLSERSAIDELIDQGEVIETFERAWIHGAENLHGTGCRLATALAIELARIRFQEDATDYAELVSSLTTGCAAFDSWLQAAIRTAN